MLIDLGAAPNTFNSHGHSLINLRFWLVISCLLFGKFALAFDFASLGFGSTSQSVIDAKSRSKLQCPVGVQELTYLEVPYWGFDQKSHTGSLIVHRELVSDVVAIFTKLHENHFPIASIRPIDEFNNDDVLSMNANNTSAFNCRAVTGHAGIFSQHSYGRAIDINPVLNPYVAQGSVQPKTGLLHVNRKHAEQGKITADGFVVALFHKYGWDWGGSWYDVQDYQHFEKRANGAKRNPYGYAAQKSELRPSRNH